MLVEGYQSSDDEKLIEQLDLPLVQSTPDVDILVEQSRAQQRLKPDDLQIYTNPRAEVLSRPVAGATLMTAFGEKTVESSWYNSPSGHHERAYMNSVVFDEQYLNYLNKGWAVDPSDHPKNGIVLNPIKYSNKFSLGSRKETLPSLEVLEKRRKVAEGTLSDEYTDQKITIGGHGAKEPTSIFHGRHEKNYQGRSWMDPPPGIKENFQDTHIPKKRLFTYNGHMMAVQCVRFFPGSGHLILSSGMDGHIKIWETDNTRKCMRTYLGHTEAVRQVNFSHGGMSFFSSSFDCRVRLWDTETGQVKCTLDTEKVPYCCTVPPDPSQQDIVLCGCDDNKVRQFDARLGKVVQEYNSHLEAVNTVTFIDEGRKIATTGDDKKLLIWEYGIPVAVKHISEPYMHSMPAAALHPEGRFVTFQSMDNQIVAYEGQGRFRFQPKKRFKGHANSGYAIQHDFANHGDILASGDVTGRLNFWNWKTAKLLRSFPAHEMVSICCQWRPNHNSQLVSAGWDGSIMLWE